ncbi:hypothetical protein OAR33_00530, partial [bacterium]|nr:hypothetical protein [bacterium]
MKPAYQHVAVDPEAFVANSGIFINKIRVDRGVILRRVDKGWAKRVSDALKSRADIRDVAAKRIRLHAQKLQVSSGCKPAVDTSKLASHVDTQGWRHAALCENERSPCDLIVIEANEASDLNVPWVTLEEFEDKDIGPAPLIEPTVENLLSLLRPLVQGAKWVLIED